MYTGWIFRVGVWKLIQGSAGRWNDWYPVPGEGGEEELRSDQQRLGPDDHQLFNIKGSLLHVLRSGNREMSILSYQIKMFCYHK